MRFAAPLAALFLLFAGSVANGQTDVKYNAAYLEKSFGLKVTKAKREPKILILTLEFTKDAENVTRVRDIFQPYPYPGNNEDEPKLLVYGFDEENVAVMRSPIDRITGEITGKKGNAFRVHITNLAGNFDPVVRQVEFRPPPFVQPK